MIPPPRSRLSEVFSVIGEMPKGGEGADEDTGNLSICESALGSELRRTEGNGPALSHGDIWGNIRQNSARSEMMGTALRAVERRGAEGGCVGADLIQ